VVRLLRVNESLVFQDTDRIPPGKRWRDEIAKALAGSNLVVVFWCHHASRSSEVSHEWRAAVEQKKDLLPLLLDSTPLPAEFHAATPAARARPCGLDRLFNVVLMF
jgi:hypothetical protein